MSQRILVIDDDPANLEFIQDALTDEGYKVSLAHDGQEGLEQCDSFKPDLILLDMRMPRMNGEKFLEVSRETGLTVPIIAITAIGMAEPLAVQLGAADFLTKPFDLNELLERIQKQLLVKKD